MCRIPYRHPEIFGLKESKFSLLPGVSVLYIPDQWWDSGQASRLTTVTFTSVLVYASDLQVNVFQCKR